ncbi:MAG: hypothetical protein GTO45_13645 [Candidatus Aminicenantes bacterium]|nr:hypothetical protein [Candidatus Aminicenantes bacterium]NIN19150.1 hypothetical protein [Candidatus Aminicenantes bacterium]NIN43054.1 hypothetical protein [Candidatus Aminicenantes bacterium]NIN85795.1 hypothetical protein [Candidatus Aminicenantes bacterium]NIO82057.1 hypothetical protein [Candidatus Aminicenantes bacterium]
MIKCAVTLLGTRADFTFSRLPAANANKNKMEKTMANEDAAEAKKASEAIKAIVAYKPRIKRGQLVDMDELVSFISGRTGLNEGTILNVLMELRDSLVFFARAARSVRVKGLGIFGPNINLEGNFSLYHKPDKWLKNELNKPRTLIGYLLNEDMIGKSLNDLIDRWNQEHPDDPIKI